MSITTADPLWHIRTHEPGHSTRFSKLTIVEFDNEPHPGEHVQGTEGPKPKRGLS